MTGTEKSNILKRDIPISAATETTSRFVEVPIVVLIPPTKVAKPIGNKTPEVEDLLLTVAPMSMGSINTTIGVLFIKALRTAPISNVANKANRGAFFQNFPSLRATGSRAPVRTNA